MEMLSIRLLLLALIGVIVFGAISKLGWRVLAGLVVLLLLIIPAGLFVVSFVTRAPQVRHEVVASSTEAVDERPEVPISEMWARLTEPRIDLHASDASSTSAEQDEQVAAVQLEREQLSRERPEWVDRPPKRVGNVFRKVAISEPFSTIDECHHDLEQKLMAAVRDRYYTLLGTGRFEAAPSVDPRSLGVSVDYILREICRDEFVETVESSVGPMKQVYVLMEFTPGIDNQLRQAWERSFRQERVVTVASIAGGVLGMVAIGYGLLSLDTMTKGYYTKRLLFGGGVAIIALIAMLVA